MSSNKEYNLAVAFIQFNKAYETLVAASKQLPDLDVSDNYPFYLLDFEAIQQDVKIWCLSQASELMSQVSDRITNPACSGCKYIAKGLDDNGLCVGCLTTKCNNYPETFYSREVVIPYMLQHGIKIPEDDKALYLLYLQSIGKEIDEVRKNE